jgi:hypothetical protein
VLLKDKYCAQGGFTATLQEVNAAEDINAP